MNRPSLTPNEDAARELLKNKSPDMIEGLKSRGGLGVVSRVTDEIQTAYGIALGREYDHNSETCDIMTAFAVALGNTTVSLARSVSGGNNDVAMTVVAAFLTQYTQVVNDMLKDKVSGPFIPSQKIHEA